MVEEKESPTLVYIETQKETVSHDSNEDGVLLDKDERASAERRLLMKLDCRLLPVLTLLYIMAYVDVRQLLLVQ